MTYLINRNYTTKSLNRLNTPDRKPNKKDGSTGDLNTHKGLYYVMVRIVCPFVRPPVCLFVLKFVPIQNGCIVLKDSSSIIKLMKGKALRKHSLHEKTVASVLLKLFINSNEWCHTTDSPLRMSRTPFSNVNNIHVHYMIPEDL